MIDAFDRNFLFEHQPWHCTYHVCYYLIMFRHRDVSMKNNFVTVLSYSPFTLPNVLAAVPCCRLHLRVLTSAIAVHVSLLVF